MTASDSTNAKGRAALIGSLWVLISVPAILALLEATQFYHRNVSNRHMQSSGEQREYLLYVPASYEGGARVPLVISMHGGAGWPAAQRDISGWNHLADEYGFIVVYPAGRGKPRRWETFEVNDDLEQDVRFIADLLDTLRTTYSIDTTRIYADGLSNGGGMAFVLSCTLADRIAAVGMVAPAQTLPPLWCPNPRPMPMIAFHGDADPILPYRGGPMGGLDPVGVVFPPARDLVAQWAKRNRCARTPAESVIAPDVVRVEYPECAEGTQVVFHLLLGGGHTWPGGHGLPEWFAGRTVQSINATRLMWAFFRTHALRGTQTAPQ